MNHSLRIGALAGVLLVAGVQPPSAFARDDMSPPPQTIAAIAAAMSHTACRTHCEITAESSKFSVTRIDLTGDGTPAYLAEDETNLCGSAGCPTSVLVQVAHQWQDALDFLGGPPLLLKHVTHGHHDLLIGFGTIEAGARAYVYAWNGQRYVSAGSRSPNGPAPAHIAY